MRNRTELITDGFEVGVVFSLGLSFILSAGTSLFVGAYEVSIFENWLWYFLVTFVQVSLLFIFLAVYYQSIERLSRIKKFILFILFGWISVYLMSIGALINNALRYGFHRDIALGYMYWGLIYASIFFLIAALFVYILFMVLVAYIGYKIRKESVNNQ